MVDVRNGDMLFFKNDCYVASVSIDGRPMAMALRATSAIVVSFPSDPPWLPKWFNTSKKGDLTLCIAYVSCLQQLAWISLYDETWDANIQVVQ